MMSAKQTIKLIVPLLAMLGLMLLVAPLGVDARPGSAPATPTNISSGGGDSDDGSGGTPNPPPSGVSGFVFNYSDGGNAPGVTVVVDGGGWQVETVTDSNGFYQVSGLGFGVAEVYLRLPPQARPVTLNQTIQLQSDVNTRLDLGFYWADNPRFPVIVTGEIINNILTVEVSNQTSATATDTQVFIETPPGLRVSPNIQTTQGEVGDYDSHMPRIDLGNLEEGAQVVITARLTEIPSLVSPDQDLDPIQLTLNYAEQPTVYMTTVDSAPYLAFLANGPVQAQQAASTSGGGGDAAAFAPPAAAATPATQPTAGAQAAPAPPSDASSEPEPGLPVTGATAKPVTSSPLSMMTIAGLILLSLAGAGWWSLRTQRFY